MPKTIITEIEQFIKNKESYTFTFNTNQLPEDKIWEDNFFKKMFYDLNTNDNHSLYWFSVDTKETGNRLKELLDTQRDVLKKNKRTVPAKNRNIDSNVLYVGVRRGGKRIKDGLTNISGRIIQHLGYYEVGSTQGLQLNYWANNTNIDVVISVIQYPYLPNEYLNIIEKIYAIKLRPVFGRH